MMSSAVKHLRDGPLSFTALCHVWKHFFRSQSHVHPNSENWIHVTFVCQIFPTT